MLKRLRTLLKRSYSPLNEIEISSENLKHNYHYLKKLDEDIRIAPVLKSNAYGHGLKLIAKELDRLESPFLCVDSLYEAYELLNAGIKTNILIMGYIDPRSLMTKKLPFSFAVYDHEVLDVLSRYQPNAKIHIFVDTGMHREGIHINDLVKFLNHVKKLSNLEVEAIMSHFAMADQPKKKLTQNQVERFQEAIKITRDEGFDPKWQHIANSSGILNHKYFKNKLGNLARAGIAIYGIDPEGKNNDLKPILQLKTHISQIKNIKKGESVGYDAAFTAKKDMIIAALPIGYYDGVDRRLSNGGFVSIEGKMCQIVGRVSMNITTIDVSKAFGLQVGQEVVIYSNKRSNNNSIEKAAEISSTIPYDLLVHLTPSTRRVIV